MIKLFAVCGITTISVIIIIFLKKLKSDIVLPLSLLLGIVLLRQAVNTFKDNSVLLENLSKHITFSEYGNILLKAFGISIIIELLSDFCREAGELTIANKIELVGKIEIIVLSLPLIEKILEIVKTLIL